MEYLVRIWFAVASIVLTYQLAGWLYRVTHPRPIKRDGDAILSGLQELQQRIDSGQPIKAIKVTRYETPDGPMHTVEDICLGDLFQDEE